MKAFLSPTAPALELEIEEKAARLSAVSGKKFFILSHTDPKISAEWILASFQSPLTIVPLSPALPTEARARALAQLPAGSWIEEKDLPSAAKAVRREKSPEEIWAVIFSSGSTGEPKGVALSGRALRAAAEAHQKVSGNGSWLLNLPLHHVGGFSVVSRAYFLGSDLLLANSRFDAQEILAWIESGRAKGLSLVPTTLSRLLKEGKKDFSTLEVVLLGGAPAEPSLVAQAIAARMPVKLTYGMTEHSSQIATEKTPGSGLAPLPGVEVKLADDDEIFVRSVCLASGFYRAGTLLPLPERGGFFATGDLGRFENGALKIDGRKSDMIITGGVKVFPPEIEAYLPEILGFVDGAVFAVPDVEWGEKVGLALVGDISPDTVKSYLAKKIEARKLPKVWIVLPQIPRTATGKVMRAELMRLATDSLAKLRL